MIIERAALFLHATAFAALFLPRFAAQSQLFYFFAFARAQFDGAFFTFRFNLTSATIGETDDIRAFARW